ncbi:zinc-binding dehydrogenase family oxidoreductase (macronuclear) [Tetrahymena thermophila SB210]|uniref:Zinc-binding dehydrogenase family oxidoreductase n=1 Tax=Tetrahymena thermophila (strain SB210) TaxID=312017 RepID=Q22WU4_TETTS|nr:zinc-binding dehydrogenase family oxidoreductase [Tetrahymena thermophila SB210]EAR89748.2 zinc-binding dehydrogenase family oxidoreductase [Tetrahymena thermophila SB210]|eukprot:XP_001009993.2 zinc-binding dehydrogenase family oxidoreductase [Tetrahymena thermophila SB210]
MEEISQGKQQQYYYKVPLQQSHREKHIFFISEDDSNIYNHAQKSVQEYIQKNKLNWLVSSYDFQKYLSNNQFQDRICGSQYLYEDIDKKQLYLDQDLTCTERTLIDYYKKYIHVFQQKFGTHIEIQIKNGSKEMQDYWSSYLRTTILEQILNEIILLSRNKDVSIILFMRPYQYATFTDLKNEFDKVNSRCNFFYVNIGDYDLKKFSLFASAIQKNYSTQQLTHKLCYAYQQYFSGKDLELFDQNKHSFIAKAIEDIIPCLHFHEIVEVQVEVYQYYWQVICGSYVISKEDHGDQIKFQYNSNEFLVKERNLDVDEMINIFSTWVNDLLVKYGLEQIDQNQIQKTIDFLTMQMEEIVRQINITNIPLNKPVENMSVRQRLIAQQSNCVRYNMAVLIKSLSNLFKIGTEVGKFHQRALAMKGIDVEAFQKMKNFFIEELLRVKSSISYESDYEKSFFSLENMKDIFLQEDIIEGFKEVKSQHHLISAFPLIGLGVKLQRSDGSMINPYLVQILDIAKINANVDTVSIQNTPDKVLNLNAGFYMGAATGYRIWYPQYTEYQPKKQVLDKIFQTQLFYYQSEQIKEKIDAVVPLFSPKDYDLKPLLSTQFFPQCGYMLF